MAVWVRIGPHIPCLSADGQSIPLDYQIERKVMAKFVVAAFNEYPCAGRHVTYKAPDLSTFSHLFFGPRQTNGYRDYAPNDGGGDKAMLREAKRDGLTRHDGGFHLLLRYSMEQGVVVTAPR